MKDKIELSDVAEIIMGQSPDSNSCNTIELGMPFLQGCGEFGKKFPFVENYCELPRKISPKNSILISVRAPVGDINLADRDFVIGRGLAGIVAKDINRDFLYYSVLQFRKQLERVSQGSTFKAINTKNLHEFKINYFNPSQQRKIAQILSTVDAVLEKTEAAIAKYQQLKQGLMHDVFTRGIDVHTGQLRPRQTEAPELYKQSPLGWIPKDWEVEELGEFIEAIDPQPSHRTPPEFHNGTPYLGINDIQNGEVQLSKCRLVNPEVLIEHKKRYSISEGDIIFGKIGTIGSAKRLSLPQSYSLSANVILIKPFRNKDLVYHYLNSKNVENQISRKIHTTSQPAFGMEKIRSLLFFNIPQIEANILEKKLNSIDQKIQTEQQAFGKYQQLKAGLLQDLLTGKVEVRVKFKL